MRKILSISIAAYNVESFIEETLSKLVINNNMEKLEVLIINDGSTDRTAKIAQKYEDMYPGVFRLISKRNGGWGSTVNFGIENAKGKYFKQLDGDDFFNTYNLEELVNFLKICEEDMVLTPYVVFDDKTNEIIEQKYIYEFDGIKFPTTLDKITKQYCGMNMHAACFKTEMLVYNEIKLEEHCFYTDVDLMIQACSFVKSVNYYSKPIYFYRTSREGQSCSVDGLITHIKDHYKVALKSLDYASRYNGNKNIKSMLTERAENMVAIQYSIAIMSKPTYKNKRSIMEFDDIIKNKYNKTYIKLNKVKRIRLLRLSNFLLLPFLHIVLKKL